MAPIGRSDNCRACVRAQVEAQKARVKKVLRKLQTAFTLRVILEIAIPTCITAFELSGIVCQMQGWQPFIWGDARQSGRRLNGEIQRGVLVSKMVIIAKRDERPNFELDFLIAWTEIVFTDNSISNYGRVFALQHEDRLLDLNTFNLVGKYWEGIKAKFLEITKALRIHN